MSYIGFAEKGFRLDAKLPNLVDLRPSLGHRIRNGTNLWKFGAAAYFLLSEADVLYNHPRSYFTNPVFGTIQVLNWQLDTIEVKALDPAPASAA